jgi:phosphoglycolate phosphatase
MAAPTIIFDLDGTLVDTAPDLIDTLNIVLGRGGLPPVDYDEARGLIGFGARRMIERGLALSGKTVPPAEIERMFSDFIAHYGEHVADKSRPFPGLEAALDTLAAQGCRFAVCTNKLERLSVLLLERLGLAARFDTICGQDTFGVQKPDPEALLGTLRRAGGSASLSLMVGDSQTDILAARAARLPVVAVDFGYTDIPVRQLSPDRIISHFSELRDAIAALLGAAPDGAAMVPDSSPSPAVPSSTY